MIPPLTAPLSPIGEYLALLGISRDVNSPFSSERGVFSSPAKFKFPPGDEIFKVLLLKYHAICAKLFIPQQFVVLSA